MPEARRSSNNSMVHLEPAEVLAVLRAAKAKGAREWSMIVLAYKQGLRASEVCNARLGDVDLKNGSIVVERLKGSLRTTQALTEHRGELPDGDDTGGASETVKPAACALDGHVGSPPNFFANPLATRQGLIGAVD